MTVITDKFAAFGRNRAESLGLAALPLVSIPHPITGIPEEDVHAHADAILDSVVHLMQTAPQAGDAA